MTWVRTYTPEQVLEAIRTAPEGKLLLRDLRERFMVDPSTMQRYVNELERAGRVQRTYLAQPGRPCEVQVLPRPLEGAVAASSASGVVQGTTRVSEAVRCLWCGGEGTVPVDGLSHPTTMTTGCPECEGTGVVRS